MIIPAHIQLRTQARILLILMLFAFPKLVNSQSGKLGFDKKEVDFGKVATVSYVPQTVKFRNNTNQDLAILIVEKSRNVKVSFERKFFTPGEEGIMAFSIEPGNEGAFEETVSIYTNLDDHPYTLTLKANVVSILECFPDPGNMLKRTIEVIDAVTKAPVPNTEVVLFHNNNFNHPLKVRVNNEGKSVEEMPIGLYRITAEATDYEILETEKYVPKSLPGIVLELVPKKKTAPPVLQPKPDPRLLAGTPLENPPSGNEPPKNQPPAVSKPLVTSTELPEDQYAANNLIFLLDVSTSMKSGRKFLLLQQSVNNLAMILRPIDNVSIITYSSEAHVALTGVNGSEKEAILNTVQELQPYGITRGVKGLNTAYTLAAENYIKGGNNQIILMTDGEFSEQGISDSEYQQMLSDYAARGISLSILGFGVNQEAINRMKLMCRAGNGSFILVRSDEFVKEVLIDEVKSKSFMGEK
ncbi:MAG: VWA domain-containing protein [Bacteroidales bacterium]|nr:VWA domain-containing protein [Bacteroidales bacterium]